MRRNPITGEWTIIATERAKRPHKPSVDEGTGTVGETHDPTCFFCYGNEHTTPPEVFTFRKKPGVPDASGWSLRVVTNKFSAFNLDGEFCIKDFDTLRTSCYARGKAEVVIESPHHSLNTALFPESQIELLLKAYKERYIELAGDPLIKYVAMFKNNGTQAGASLEHPHSQVIATPVVPPIVETELQGAKKYFEENKSCVYCDIVESELKDKSRVICENENFVAFAPYASKSPFESWVMPKYHTSSYYKLTETQIKKLAEVWKQLLLKIYKGLGNPPYNYFIHTSPTEEHNNEYFHWHMELLPKVSVMAGFELGTGMFINIAIPEQCAEYLRDIN